MSGNDATGKKVENFAEHAVRRFVLTVQPKSPSFALRPYGQYAAQIGKHPIQGAKCSARCSALVDAGGTVVQDAMDVGNGMLVARLKDPSGALVGLRHPPSA